MIKLLLLFAVLLVSVWVGVQLSHDPGYLLIAINHWTVETTLWVAITGMIIVFLLLHGLLVLLNRLHRLPENYQQWKVKHRTQKAQAKTRKGLIEFSEGHWQSAQNHLIKALPNTDTPLINYLTAARAAQEMGDNQLRDDYLREAQQSMPDAKIAVELTQAQLQLANQQWEQALATLRHLQDMTPHHAYVLKLLTKLYQEVRDWPQLIALLPELQKYKIFTGLSFEKLRHQAYLQALADMLRLSHADAARKLMDSLPKPLRYDPEINASYCEFLIKDSQQQQAETILYRCLRHQFNSKLVALYGRINVNDRQLTFVESLLKKYPDSAELFLAAGRLCLAHELWGKAKSYFEQSIAIKAMPETYMELGKLLERFGDQGDAMQAYQQGLSLSL
ncbi:heme biosynthesis HemY N-terminal domain-containing protein [Legionella dresdenensis]|uniref:Heme biosynthesis HemY N-terminal domain-containing protein n=1 Tax=Legionella dresdenensis TaxID=450200 RepID=A0ABV8CDH5_9GAMM